MKKNPKVWIDERGWVRQEVDGYNLTVLIGDTLIGNCNPMWLNFYGYKVTGGVHQSKGACDAGNIIGDIE